jgi:hypothetical protein
MLQRLVGFVRTYLGPVWLFKIQGLVSSFGLRRVGNWLGKIAQIFSWLNICKTKIRKSASPSGKKTIHRPFHRLYELKKVTAIQSRTYVPLR